MSVPAFDGLKVLDLTTSTFNYAGKLLAGFGADVVKVEPPGGEEIRWQPPFRNDQPDAELSGRHLHMNTGKRSVVLDLDDPIDVERFVGLLRDYNVVIESFRPGYLSERGLAYEDLQALRPDLIMASISHFGQSGPYAAYAGSEIASNALSGYLYLTGDPDRPPVKAFDNLIEFQAALHAAVAIMAAATGRDVAGGGDHLDISATEAGMFLLGGHVQDYYWRREVPRRSGTRLLQDNPAANYPASIRPCLGGYAHVHTSYRHPDLLAVLMELPELNDPEIAATPRGHADQIDEIMSRWLMKHDKFEIARRAQEMRIPTTEVLTPAEVLSDPHLRERGFFVEVPHPIAGVVTQPGTPGLFTGTPWETRRAPLLGEHQDDVLGASLSDSGAPLSHEAGSRTHARRAPLEGIRILEMTGAVAGPTACWILGDLGAEVIRIQEPSTGAATYRNLPPPRDGVPDRPYNRVTHAIDLNRGKKLVALNVAKPEGRKLFLRLAAKSDVVVENFSPRVVANLGIDYADLRKINPSIVMVSMPGFGKTGPYRDRRAHGPGIDAMTGISHLTGYPDRGPGNPGLVFGDQTAGLHAALAVMIALRHRRRTGQGQYIEMSMFEGELQALGTAIMDVTLNGRDRTRIGNRHDWYAPHGVYPCQGDEEWVAIAVTSDQQWQALCRALGRADLAVDERYLRQADRHARQDELDPIIAEWTAVRSHYEAQTTLQAVGVSAGAVLRVNELYTDPQSTHRGSLVWIDHPEVGPSPHTRLAWLSEGGNGGIAGPGPAFGGGNDYVLRGLLGMGDAQIEELIREKITAYVPIGYEGEVTAGA